MSHCMKVYIKVCAQSQKLELLCCCLAIQGCFLHHTRVGPSHAKVVPGWLGHPAEEFKACVHPGHISNIFCIDCSDFKLYQDTV